MVAACSVLLTVVPYTSCRTGFVRLELTLPKKWCQIIGRVWTEPHSLTPAEGALYRPGNAKVSGPSPRGVRR